MTSIIEEEVLLTEEEPKQKQEEDEESNGSCEERERTIGHEIGGVQNDTLRSGLSSVKSEIVESHPLPSAYQSTKEEQEQTKRRILLNTYGSAFPLKTDLDRQMLSKFQRPSGPIPSSMLGFEALTGCLEDFAFQDYLNDPRESETLRPLDMHHGVEVRLGLAKGPPCSSYI